MKKKKKLIRNQLDATLQKLRPLLGISIPPKGWIRAIRDALGMNGQQLADRLRVTQQRVAEIQSHELRGSVTLRTMRKMAENLDCVFVYALVPSTTLEKTVYEQAKQVAQRRLARASHTMSLENQELSNETRGKALDDLAEELVETLPSTLWDKV